MSKLFSDYLNESGNAPSAYLTEAEKLNADKAFVPENYSVSDFEQDASVQVAFDKVQIIYQSIVV